MALTVTVRNKGSVCANCGEEPGRLRQCAVCGKDTCNKCAGEACKEGVICVACSGLHFFSQDLTSGRLEVINKRTKHPIKWP